MQQIKSKVFYCYIIELEKSERSFYCPYKIKNISLLPEQKNEPSTDLFE